MQTPNIKPVIKDYVKNSLKGKANSATITPSGEVKRTSFVMPQPTESKQINFNKEEK